MAVFVTRPGPDGAKTAAALRAKGYETLVSPALCFEPKPYQDDETDYDAVIVTSANALRAIADEPVLARLRKLKLFAVGGASAEAARQHGFTRIASAEGDGASLRDLIVRSMKKKGTLCYLAGADLSRDLVGELRERGFTVIKHVTYRMTPVGRLPDEAVASINAQEVEAVLHYSRRSARAFLGAAQSSGVEILALALAHCCISPAVGATLHEAGASRVVVAQTPDEDAMFDALDRTLKPSPR